MPETLDDLGIDEIAEDAPAEEAAVRADADAALDTAVNMASAAKHGNWERIKDVPAWLTNEEIKAILPPVPLNWTEGLPEVPRDECQFDVDGKSHPPLAIMRHISGVDVGFGECVYYDNEKYVAGSAKCHEGWYETRCRLSELQYIPENFAQYLKYVEDVKTAHPTAAWMPVSTEAVTKPASKWAGKTVEFTDASGVLVRRKVSNAHRGRPFVAQGQKRGPTTTMLTLHVKRGEKLSPESVEASKVTILEDGVNFEGSPAEAVEPVPAETPTLAEATPPITPADVKEWVGRTVEFEDENGQTKQGTVARFFRARATPSGPLTTMLRVEQAKVWGGYHWKVEMAKARLVTALPAALEEPGIDDIIEQVAGEALPADKDAAILQFAEELWLGKTVEFDCNGLGKMARGKVIRVHPKPAKKNKPAFSMLVVQGEYSTPWNIASNNVTVLVSGYVALDEVDCWEYHATTPPADESTQEPLTTPAPKAVAEPAPLMMTILFKTDGEVTITAKRGDLATIGTYKYGSGLALLAAMQTAENKLAALGTTKIPDIKFPEPPKPAAPAAKPATKPAAKPKASKPAEKPASGLKPAPAATAKPAPAAMPAPVEQPAAPEPEAPAEAPETIAARYFDKMVRLPDKRTGSALGWADKTYLMVEVLTSKGVEVVSAADLTLASSK